MSKSECPEALKNCHPVFLKLVNPQVRDTLTTDINALTSLFDDVEELDDDTIVWNEQMTQVIFPEVRQGLSAFLEQGIVVPQTAPFFNISQNFHRLPAIPTRFNPNQSFLVFPYLGGSSSWQRAWDNRNHGTGSVDFPLWISPN